MISKEELARRLCVANHRSDFSTGGIRYATVPCGDHLAEAERVHALTRPEYRKSLEVVLVAAGAFLDYDITVTETIEVEEVSA